MKLPLWRRQSHDDWQMTEESWKKKWNNFEIINNYCVSWRLQINKNTFLKLTWSRHRVRLEAELTIVQWQESDFSDCVRTVCWCRHSYSWHGVVSSNYRNTKGNNNRLWQERIQWQAGSYKNPWGKCDRAKSLRKETIGKLLVQSFFFIFYYWVLQSFSH